MASEEILPSIRVEVDAVKAEAHEICDAFARGFRVAGKRLKKHKPDA
jgi:hypothetical protein